MNHENLLRFFGLQVCFQFLDQFVLDCKEKKRKKAKSFITLLLGNNYNNRERFAYSGSRAFDDGVFGAWFGLLFLSG